MQTADELPTPHPVTNLPLQSTTKPMNERPGKTRCKAKDLPELQSRDKVWICNQDRMGRVLAASSSPQSYIREHSFEGTGQP